jgi:hypothetical protein
LNIINDEGRLKNGLKGAEIKLISHRGLMTVYAKRMKRPRVKKVLLTMRYKIILMLLIVADFLLFAGIIDPRGDTIEKRFDTPEGFKRVQYEKGSFEESLRSYRLKKDGSPVKLYDGRNKTNAVYVAVLEMPILKQDLIQCADAVIKLRAEYFYQKDEYSKIEFTLTNGMIVAFSRFADGFRVKVRGNKTEWIRWGKTGNSREVFDEYLEFIYTYCGTASLSKEMEKAEVADIKIGDVFIEGGSPGHAVIVVDLAENRTGEKVMLLAQSYMPSQEMHILKSSSDISPWQKVEDTELITPEWKFKQGSLKRFGEPKTYSGRTK